MGLMIRCILMLLGPIAAVLFVGAGATAVSAVPDRPRLDAPTSQLGVPVNGLRLEVAARFIAEDDGRGEPRLEQTVIFHNESDATICLDVHEIHDSLVLAHISPSSMVKVRSTIAPWG